MTLTPEDALNKHFQSTKFREGYDQDEVDDFLDQVVAELRRLTGEGGELRRRLSACQALLDRPEGLPAGLPEAAGAPAMPDAPSMADPLDPRVAVPAGPWAGPEPSQNDREAVARVLAVAQERHDRYVREAGWSRDRIVTGAREHATQLVLDAEKQRRQTIGPLEAERIRLDATIRELRGFERECRARLRSYLEGRVGELDAGADRSVPGRTSA